jgi:hypothetical protein
MAVADEVGVNQGTLESEPYHRGGPVP